SAGKVFSPGCGVASDVSAGAKRTECSWLAAGEDFDDGGEVIGFDFAVGVEVGVFAGDVVEDGLVAVEGVLDGDEIGDVDHTVAIGVAGEGAGGDDLQLADAIVQIGCVTGVRDLTVQTDEEGFDATVANDAVFSEGNIHASVSCESAPADVPV